MPNSADTDAWLILLRAPRLGAVTLRRLVARAGGAAAAVRDAQRLRAELPLSDEALAWLRAPAQDLLDTDRAWLAAAAHRLLTWDDADYPPLLREIAAAPAALYVVGDAAALWLPQVAIVGARSASAAGVAIARSFARHLALAGLAITSGLADGIDGAAHAAALEAKATTVAVMGTGPDLVYPRKHHALAERIVAAGGALVSEFPPGTQARPEFFPRRNRIIAALSLGTLVVEASLQSGSLITAQLAADQGREVFAVPGSIHNPLARGCHRLIRQGAKLVETAEEVVAELSPLAQALGERLRAELDAPGPAPTAPAPNPRDADYARLIAALGHAPASLDELAERTALSVAALSSMLLLLELEGEVEACGSGRYMLRAPVG